MTTSAALGDWRELALCRDEDPELFFPIGSTGPAVAQAAHAVQICRRCSVTEACLAWALEHHQDAGVWGGLTEDERRSLLRRRRAATGVRSGSLRS
jgi:WhiB family redox-sensing transcriptional regulator